MDALAKLKANFAMVHSIGTIDPSIDDVAKARLLDDNARQYADHCDCSLDEASAMVAKIVKSVDPKEQVRRAAVRTRQAAERAAAARRKLHGQHDPRAAEKPSASPDPNLIGDEKAQRMKHATNAQMLKLAQAGIAEEVRKMRADNPRLTENQARARIMAENDGLRESLVKLAQGPENEFAKVSSSAEVEVSTKSAEIKKEHPQLTDAQAYTRAMETTPGLMKRLLHEQRSGSCS